MPEMRGAPAEVRGAAMRGEGGDSAVTFLSLVRPSLQDTGLQPHDLVRVV